MPIMDFLEITSRKSVFITAIIKSKSNHQLAAEVSIPLAMSMVEGEGRSEQAFQALNVAGTLSCGELLKRFDTDGSAI